MKKTILVPTDFSANAKAAVHYAIGMAKKYGFGIHLTHVYAPLTTRFGDESFNSRMVTHAEDEANTAIKQWHGELSATHPELEIFSECLEGDSLSDVLKTISGKASHQLIVMGTRGASGLKHILGSNTYQTILKSPLPVMAVPENCGDFDLRHAGLLSNFKASDIPLLETFVSIFGRDIPVTLIHIRESNSPQEEAELIAWKSHVEKATGLRGLGWKIDTVVNRLDAYENLLQCIHNMADEAQLEALLITATVRSFFERLFSRNLVKNMAHQLDRPVFFLREG